MGVWVTVCEAESTNTTPVFADTGQLLNVSCTADSECQRLHFAAVCQVTGLEYNSTGSVRVQKECACNTERHFYRRADSCGE